MLANIQTSAALFEGSWTPSPCPSDNRGIQEQYGATVE
jgi:hypothetical protein